MRDQLHTVPRSLARQLNPLLGDGPMETIGLVEGAVDLLIFLVLEGQPPLLLANAIHEALRYEITADAHATTPTATLPEGLGETRQEGRQ